MTIQEILPYFKSAKRLKGNSYQCTCPAHDDKTSSLTVSEKNNKILMKCHAGCDTGTILERIGLTFADLGAVKKENTWKSKLEYAKGKKIQDFYNYTDSDGRYLYTKVRFEDKEMLFGVLQGDFFKYGINGIDKTLYNLPALVKAVNNGCPVYITEGEKDVKTLKELGLTACTAGGVNDWKPEFARYFTGAKVIILPDNDKAGLELKDRIIKDLKNFAHAVKWVLTSRESKGDVTDYIKKEKHNKEDLKKLVESEEYTAAPWIYTDSSGKPKINADIMADALRKNMEYVKVRRRDDDKEDIYFYQNGVYSLCNKNEFKGYIKKYIPIGLASDTTLNNVYNLMLCSSDKTRPDSEINAESGIINLRNGLYNIETKSLMPHSADILSTIQLNCEYDLTAPAPGVFHRYINDLCTDDNGEVDSEKTALLQEWMGLLISNIPVYRVKSCLILYSPLGNTGKSQFLSLICNLIGFEYVVNIPIQKLSERFSVGSIHGKRLVMVGDQESGDIEDSSVFKQLTGGDAVSAEKKGKQPFSFVFNGGIIMACNGLPSFTDDKGGHVFERLNIVPLTNSIPKEKQDSRLLDKMLKEKSGILLWALEGLHRLIENNYKFTRSKACEEAATEFRRDSDTLFNFINANYTVTGDNKDRIDRAEFNKEYLDWCCKMELTPLKKKNIQERALKNGLGVTKYCGSYSYTGIRKKYCGFVDITGTDENLPFDDVI